MTRTVDAVSIRLNDDADLLSVEFDDGKTYDLAAEYLRVFSPSAEVRGHAPGDAVLQVGKRAVKIRRVDPVGEYAVQIRFDDAHGSGIYSWEWLYELGERHGELWADYLEQLAAAGATREAE